MAKKEDKTSPSEDGSQKKREEIERLKKKIEELEKDIEKEDLKSLKKTSDKKEDEKKKYIRILIILVIIILIVDIISLIAYYKPDFFKIKSPSQNKTNDSINLDGKKCLDGTLSGSCSKEKPFFCYNGELLKNAEICGCPEGYKLDFQDCKRI